MGRVNGKIAIVTGAARGQGEAEARILIAEGAKVMLTDILDTEGEKLAQELGENASYMSHNVCDETAWLDVVEATEAKFGPVTVLINNAGILKISALQDTSLEEYMQVINVNQVGVFLGMKHVIGSAKHAEQAVMDTETDRISGHDWQKIDQFVALVHFWSECRARHGGQFASRGDVKPHAIKDFLHWTFIADSMGYEELTVRLSAAGSMTL